MTSCDAMQGLPASIMPSHVRYTQLSYLFSHGSMYRFFHFISCLPVDCCPLYSLLFRFQASRTVLQIIFTAVHLLEHFCPRVFPFLMSISTNQTFLQHFNIVMLKMKALSINKIHQITFATQSSCLKSRKALDIATEMLPPVFMIS